nr:hypothetical protein [Bradyrhizobium sp. WD16]
MPAEDSASVSDGFKVGDRHPLGAGSLALLSALDDDEIDTILRANASLIAEQYPNFSSRLLRSLIEQTRKRSYALNPGLLMQGSGELGFQSGMATGMWSAPCRSPRWSSGWTTRDSASWSRPCRLKPGASKNCYRNPEAQAQRRGLRLPVVPCGKNRGDPPRRSCRRCNIEARRPDHDCASLMRFHQSGSGAAAQLHAFDDGDRAIVMQSNRGELDAACKGNSEQAWPDLHGHRAHSDPSNRRFERRYAGLRPSGPCRDNSRTLRIHGHTPRPSAFRQASLTTHLVRKSTSTLSSPTTMWPSRRRIFGKSSLSLVSRSIPTYFRLANA